MAIKELVRRRVRVGVVLIDGESFGGMFKTLNTVPALYDAGVSPFVVKTARRYSDSAVASLHP